MENPFANAQVEHIQRELMARLPTASTPVGAVLKFFAFAHLPHALQLASAHFAELALYIAAGPSNPETTVALRKLLEAKDAAVRARIP